LMPTRRRHFGRVRKLPSGRYQVRYPGPDGRLRTAPETFERKRDAELWLSRKEAEIAKGDWVNPDGGKVTVAAYSEAWVRPGLRPKTVTLYEGLVKLHIGPTLGELALSAVTPQRIRRWRRELLDRGVGPVTVAKAYRLLRAILNTAVADRLIGTNPCQIPGAGQEKSPERPIATLDQVLAIAANVPERLRLLVLLACFNSLRWGELAGLARRHVQVDTGTMSVDPAMVELSDGSLVFGPPKSEASVRVVTIPAAIIPDLVGHLAEFTGPGPDDLLFVGPKGGPLRRSNFQEHWRKGTAAAGVVGLHFHDLRHTGNTWAAETGATLRDLMDRMGHATTRAALIYLHRFTGRDKVIADALSRMLEDRKRMGQDDEDPDEGAAGVRVPA
jgi:integrase